MIIVHARLNKKNASLRVDEYDFGEKKSENVDWTRYMKPFLHRFFRLIQGESFYLQTFVKSGLKNEAKKLLMPRYVRK